jgi:DNA-directed RNA polymerase subunit beta'
MYKQKLFVPNLNRFFGGFSPISFRAVRNVSQEAWSLRPRSGEMTKSPSELRLSRGFFVSTRGGFRPSPRFHSSMTSSPQVFTGNTPKTLGPNFLQIGLATSEDIQDWALRSYVLGGKYVEIGEVKKADTINYRSFKPEKDGLFCERIFGPVNDWICACGTSNQKPGFTNLSKVDDFRNSGNNTAGRSPNLIFDPITFRFQGTVSGGGRGGSRGGAPNAPSIPKICPQCQVEFTLSRIRRYRMGFIALACSVTHIWYLNSRPNLFSVLFKMPTKYVKKIAYYKGYTPSDPKLWNPCLGPGGDFFDTEWEFVHLWLGSREANTRGNSGYFGGGAPGGPPPTGGFEKTSRYLLEYLPSGCTEAVKNRSAAGDDLPGLCPRNSRQYQNSLGLVPSWLENTGAEAFQNYAQQGTAHWEKEFQKFQDELRRTPKNIEIPNADNLKGDPSKAPEAKTPFLASSLSGLGTKYSSQPFLMKRRKKRVRTLKFLNILRTAGGPEAFASSGFILNKIPVLPPELRPIVQLNAGQLASSDVNDLYRRVLSRNNRLKYYLTGCGPHPVEFLVRSERHLVQLAVDALFENGKTTNVRHSTGQKGGGSRTGPPYKSLSDRIGGKQGRFRQNLLGKRVDYSGRSVIAVGPKLQLHECGLPIEMALELFQAFFIRHIMELQLAKTIRGAKNFIRFNQPLARQLLQNVVESHPILLNRAPTLHRLGIQAFQPKLVSGRAIQLHPLVCSAFNADFDGDQMAVHIPLSPQARIEARLLMCATTNWLSPATGQPSILPSQDMVLGFYYLSMETPSRGGDSLLSLGNTPKKSAVDSSQDSSPLSEVSRESVEPSFTHVFQAYNVGKLELHQAVWVRTDIPTSQIGGSMNTGAPPHRKKLQRKSASGSLQFNTSSLVAFPRTKGSGRAPLPDEPLHIRLSQCGTWTKLYSSYKWLQDSNGQTRYQCIRTTPGRILVNQIMHDFQG